VTEVEMPRLSTHFLEKEFLCKCGCGAGAGKISPDLIEMLEDMRVLYGKSIRIASGFRCPAHNAAVGGTPKSAHLTGEAADIVCILPRDRYNLLTATLDSEAKRIGIGNGFLHVDVSETLPQNVIWTYGND
jgi:zinc D-Ala-D-Ala carboxypeptidase